MKFKLEVSNEGRQLVLTPEGDHDAVLLSSLAKVGRTGAHAEQQEASVVFEMSDDRPPYRRVRQMFIQL